jgi:hypothetical protein
MSHLSKELCPTARPSSVRELDPIQGKLHNLPQRLGGFMRATRREKPYLCRARQIWDSKTSQPVPSSILL